MFSSLRTRFGIPGAISVIALVFAMLGGAWAANNSGGGEGAKATASAKKKAKKGPRGPKGAKGEAGPAGPQGPAGDKGDAGAAGKDGAKGATGTAGAKGATGAAGVKGATGAKGATGTEGSPWTELGTLPSGETLTGTWGETSPSGSPIIVPISFSLPLSEDDLSGLQVHLLEPTEVETDECPGTTTKPLAEPGHLCVYISLQVNASPLSTGSKTIAGTTLSGAATGTPALVTGTWALTAP